MGNQSKIEIILSAVDRGLTAVVNRVTKQVSGLESGVKSADKASAAMQRSLDRLKLAASGAFAAIGAQNMAAGFIATADAMRNMDQRLLLTAKNTADYAAAQKTVVEVARDSHQGLSEVSTLYTRMALATANLNVSQKELAEVTRTVALATALSGSSASEASAGLQQFAQAMAANRLGGDELRSVLENMPLLTKVFVDAAGGSMATLRDMAEQGELTTQWMMDAIKRAKETIEAQAAAMPMTVGRATTFLRNETAKFIDAVNQATGTTDTMAGSIQWLGQNIDLVAKGGVVALTAALSLLVGRGLTAAVVSTSTFITSLRATISAATATGAAVSSASAYMSGSYTAAAASAAATTGSRLIPALLGLVNPITAITTVLGLGAAAWALWGRSADDELTKAKGRVAELQRTNQMLKELSDPGIRLQTTTRNIESARAEVARLEKELAAAASGPVAAPFDDSIGRIAAQLDQAQQKLKTYEQEHAETQKNIEISTKQRGVKEIAVELSVTAAIKKQDEERRKVTSSKLENDLAEIQKKRAAELKVAEAQFKADDLTRVQKAINARFDAEAAKAREEADEKAAKKAEAAGRKAEAEAKRRERELLKEEKLRSKIDTEALRAESENRILALEGEKLEAERLGSELARAEALLEINRRIASERIALKEQEAKLVSDDPNKTQADLLRSQSEISREKISGLQQEHSDLARVASARLAEIEQAWRRGTGSVDAYRQAVQAALAAGVIDQEEATNRLVASGDDMGAALALGFRNARESMQTDAEMMIQIGEGLSEQLAGGMVSAWDGFITGTKSAKEALIDFARSTISWLSQIILKQMLLNALGSAGGNGSSGSGLIGAISSAVSAAGYAAGGSIQALAGGGAVLGWSPHPRADNIPIWATAREFMQPVDAVDYYGLPFMELVRRKLFPRNLARALSGATLPRIPSGNRLAGGGIPAAAPATTFKAGDTKLRVINVLDHNMVGDHLRTADGETAIINLIRRNSSSIKAILGRG